MTAVEGDYHAQVGNKLNFATMSVQYMGNGSSADPTIYGLDAKIDKIVIGTKFHRHVYDNDTDKECNECGFVRELYTPGDLDGEEGVSSNDAIYLLYYTLFGR